MSELLKHQLEPFRAWRHGTPQVLKTGLGLIDDLLPHGGFARGAIHELLADKADDCAISFAVVIARAAAANGGMLVWCNTRRDLYPPAMARQGIDLNRFLLLRPRNRADEVWAVTECLRCKAVNAVIASPSNLSQIEARRLQLAAERGGSVGLLLRRMDSAISRYAAATRWRVEPAPGTQWVRRWRLQLIHGHGGRVGECVLLEVCRETNLVRAVEAMADRPPQTPDVRVTA